MARKQPTQQTQSIASSMQVLDSKINLIAQKIKTMEKNEAIMGRTLIALNRKIKELEVKVAGDAGNATGKAVISEDYATKKELQELKYILDNLNPLEYATIDQVKDLLRDRDKKK